MNEKQKKYQKNILSFVILIAALGLATAVGFIFVHFGIQKTNIVMIYLVTILVISIWISGYSYGFLAAVLSTCFYNYFFIVPYFSFSVNNMENTSTFIIMTIVAFIGNTLAIRMKKNEEKFKRKEEVTRVLYRLSNALSEVFSMDDIAFVAVKTISDFLKCNTACLLFDDEGKPKTGFIQMILPDQLVHRETKNYLELYDKIRNQKHFTYTDHEFCNYAIYGQENVLGIVRIPIKQAMQIDEMQERVLISMIESIAISMDRFNVIKKQLEAREEIENERYRSNLLRSISHDLRTPLSIILGTSEMLIDMTQEDKKVQSTVQDIFREASWLQTLVENILNLTRLQEGKLLIEKKPEAVEEVVGFAVQNILRRYPEYHIDIQLPEKLLIVPMDVHLMVQVLINLLENAIKHTKSSDHIKIDISEDLEKKHVKFVVADCGEGINEEEMDKIFQMFYTSDTKSVEAQYGIGLGLTICETIIKAHGGTIYARNKTGSQGAEFIFELPMGG